MRRKEGDDHSRQEIKQSIDNILANQRKKPLLLMGSNSLGGPARDQESPKKQSRKEDQPPQSTKQLLEGLYKIKKKISQGGFGKVYLAVNINTKEEFVVKVNAEVDMNDNEFEIMKHLSDLKLQGFPKVYSSGQVQNQPYIILERLGLSVKDILKRNKKHFSIKCIMTMGLQLVELLERFHDQGYIHCDLKPDNIMIGNYVNDP